MPWSLFLTAVGLLLICEGLMPFLSPQFWKKLMQQMMELEDQLLRIMGLISMLSGLALIVLARYLYA